MRVTRVVLGVLGGLLVSAVVAGFFAWQSRQESEERLEEVLSSWDEAYQRQGERQAQIDSLYGVCSSGWVGQTAKNAAETVNDVIALTDVAAAASEIELHFGAFCTDYDIGAFCQAYAQSVTRFATEEVDREGIEERCFQDLEARAASAGSDVQVDDCVVFSIALGGVSAVDCSEPHEGEVISLFGIEGDEYPGDEAVELEAEQGCPPLSTFFYPTKGSWKSRGDRQVICILPVSFSLEVGECVIYSENLQRVSCSAAHDAEVIGAIEMPGTRFPGTTAVEDYVLEICPEGTDQYLYPSEESWAIGDRLVACLDE